ncbi:hypothetical protein F0562_027897 [Nyssa sinensis]|uniref:Uncharacterized protein n=1 Tax=Nyssa sinensis TaxID=561372 RepID=A0A5J5B6U7_9ASTE|nr:hypothetical protein F0562_027897 [Nyssa sinensis]
MPRLMACRLPSNINLKGFLLLPRFMARILTSIIMLTGFLILMLKVLLLSINRGYNTGGSETGECRTRSKLAAGKKLYLAVQPQQSWFPAIRKVTVQPPATTVAIQSNTQRADPIGDGKEDNLAGVSILVGQTSEGAHPNLYTAHGKAKGHAALPTDHTDYTAIVTSKFNTLASSSSVGNTVPSQHEAPSNVDQVQPLQPAPIPKLVSTCGKIFQPQFAHGQQAATPSLTYMLGNLNTKQPNIRSELNTVQTAPTNPCSRMALGPPGQHVPLANPTVPSAQQLVVPSPYDQQNPPGNPTDPSFQWAQQMAVCHQVMSTATYKPPLTHLTTGQPNETDPSAPKDKAKGLAPFYGGPYQTIPSSIHHSDTPISVTHPDSITLPLLSTNPIETEP